MSLFRDIRDQEHAIGILQRAITADKVPHAYLFEGPAGVGKRMAAYAFARALNCEQNSDDGCDSCENCRKINSGIHPDVSLLTVPEDKRIIPIDSVREATRFLSLRPHEGKAKVLIIEPADLLTSAAANALLKTLEEPRAGNFIVLITSRVSSLLPTVRSRCGRVRFRPLKDSTVLEFLLAKGIDPERAGVAATLAEGSLQRAEEFVGEEFDRRFAAALDLLVGAVMPTPQTGLAVTAEMRGGRDEAVEILEVLLSVLRELMWLTQEGTSTSGERPLAQKVVEANKGILERTNLTKVTHYIDAVHDAAVGIRERNLNPQMAAEGMLMRMRGHIA